GVRRPDTLRARLVGSGSSGFPMDTQARLQTLSRQMQARHDCPRWDRQRLGELAIVEFAEVAQPQNLTVVLGKSVERRCERFPVGSVGRSRLRQLALIQVLRLRGRGLPEDIDTTVAHDCKPPSFERPAGIESPEALQAPQGRFLYGVLRVLAIAQN